MFGNMPSFIPNPTYDLREDLQQHNALRTAAEATATVKSFQGELQVTSSLYGCNLPGMTHRNRVAPYPTPQQHLAQKRPVQYNPMLHQWSSMQHYGGAMQQGFSAAQVTCKLHFYNFKFFLFIVLAFSKDLLQILSSEMYFSALI